MENISTFLAAAQQLGCPAADLFQTVDLFEEKNPYQVVQAVFSLSRHAAETCPDMDIPVLGPKLVKRRTLQFTEEKLLEARSTANTFQYGYAGGANASGIYFGKRRDIGGEYPRGGGSNQE